MSRPLAFRTASEADAPRVHAMYRATPGYFEVLSIPLPSETEVRTELRTAASDTRRITELVVTGDDPGSEVVSYDDELHGWPIGYLDVTLDYLEPGDATVNLLLVRADLQGRGYGSAVVRAVEARLRGRVRRVLASIYGRNPRARRFWRSLGYAFAIDAAPVLEWYAKDLTPCGEVPSPRGAVAGRS
ncbi:MAG: GNAT family N-acetyltransferase [Trueperaceae bacterium]